MATLNPTVLLCVSSLWYDSDSSHQKQVRAFYRQIVPIPIPHTEPLYEPVLLFPYQPLYQWTIDIWKLKHIFNGFVHFMMWLKQYLNSDGIVLYTDIMFFVAQWVGSEWADQSNPVLCIWYVASLPYTALHPALYGTNATIYSCYGCSAMYGCYSSDATYHISMYIYNYLLVVGR